MKLFFFFFTFFALTIVAEAGTIQITGEGRVSSPPNEVSLAITIYSICYDSTLEARNANSVQTEKLLNAIKKYQKKENDLLTTSPGGFVLSTEYIPSEEGRDRILCERKWKTWNKIKTTLHSLDDFSLLQDELTKLISSEESINPDKKAQSFVHISSPAFSLTEETMLNLRKAAQRAALFDAQDQFSNFDANCNFIGVHLTTVSSPVFNSLVRFEAKGAFNNDTLTPTIPEDIIVSASWTFIWEFKESTQCFN